MGWEAVKDTWRVVWKRLEAAKHGWSVVTGPISAMCQYLRDLQVDGHDPSRWVFEERVLEIKPSEVSVVCQTSSFLTDIIKTQRSRRMGSAGAGGGVDWTVPRRLLKSVRTKTTRYAYRAVFQVVIPEPPCATSCMSALPSLVACGYRGTFWRRSAVSLRTACGFGVCFPLNTSQSLPRGT